METKLEKPQLKLWSFNCEDWEKPQWNSKISDWLLWAGYNILLCWNLSFPHTTHNTAG